MNIQYINPDALDVATLNSGWCRIPGTSYALGASVDNHDWYSDLVTQFYMQSSMHADLLVRSMSVARSHATAGARPAKSRSD